jgi:hypothetical protein
MIKYTFDAGHSFSCRPAKGAGLLRWVGQSEGSVRYTTFTT